MTQRTTTEIAADLAAYRAARTALVTGERVEDIWKNGRRMRFSTMTLGEINAAINDLMREHEQAVAVEAGSPRRRPIGLAWGN